MTAAEIPARPAPGVPAIQVLGRKLDSIPFSAYHIGLILVLGLVGFVEGYDLASGGSLLVLAKGRCTSPAPTSAGSFWGPRLVVALAGLSASLLSDRLSRKTVMQIGVIVSTFFTLLIPLAQNAEQLIMLRLLTGIGLGFAISAPFPIAAELMPAQHRRTYGAIYEVMLASAFTLLPFIGFVLAGNVHGFRLIALPGGLALFVVPVLLHFAFPRARAGCCAAGSPQAAVDDVNNIIRRCRQPRAAVDARRARAKAGSARRAAAAVFGVVPPRPAALDRRRHPVLDCRRHLLLRLRDPAAEGPGRPGGGRGIELRAEFAAVHGEHPGQVFHRLSSWRSSAGAGRSPMRSAARSRVSH